MSAPALEPHCGSWVIVRKVDGVAVLETFSARVASAINLTAYDVLTAAQWLGSLNGRTAR